MTRYRVYANTQGWKLIDMKTNIEEAIGILDGLVANDINEFILVESSRENGDVPLISTMRSYIEYKEKLKPKNKVKRLV